MKVLYRVFVGILFLALLAGCAQATPTEAPAVPANTAPAPTDTTAPVPTDTGVPEPVLEVIGGDQTVSLSMADLEAMTPVVGQAGIKSSTGAITLPQEYKGVSIKDLVALVGNFDNSMGVSVEAVDGYAITFSYDQVTGGNFIAYDPATGEEISLEDPLTLILAYERDGQPFPEEQDGKIRLAIVGPKNNQVTDGHWSVKWVNKIEVKSFGDAWTVMMHGANAKEELDRASFESCAAPGCHGATWTDSKAQKWSGVPLWLLVGWMDDDIQHNGPAFNDALADSGYTVRVIAKDGYQVEFDSARVKRNDNLIVANQVNDTPLVEKDFPLKLVGDDVQKKEGVGGIAEIALIMEAAAAPEATEEPAVSTEAPPASSEAPAAAGEGVLSVAGLVEEPLALGEADLRALQVVKITAEHPKKGNQEYEGVTLKTLFEQAKIKDGAKKLVVTASDGYSVELDLASVQACEDCMVAFTETEGSFNLVMPGLDSAAWVKSVVQLEIK
jgi:hypothetical protein